MVKRGSKTKRPSKRIGQALREAYRLMRQAQGHQQWWPGETRFEICVGAILTQNTSWKNVERAIGNLKEANALAPKVMYRLSHGRLAELIKPAGYFNVKANRLRAFLKVLMEEHGGKTDRLLSGPTAEVRERLLSISGIGAETADSMLLYAGEHLSFVIDAYTKRVFTRHRWSSADADYDDLKALCENALGGAEDRNAQLDYWQDYHAQLVMVGKDYCRPKDPLCEECPLKPLLPRQGSR